MFAVVPGFFPGSHQLRDEVATIRSLPRLFWAALPLFGADHHDSLDKAAANQWLCSRVLVHWATGPRGSTFHTGSMWDIQEKRHILYSPINIAINKSVQLFVGWHPRDKKADVFPIRRHSQQQLCLKVTSAMNLGSYVWTAQGLFLSQGRDCLYISENINADFRGTTSWLVDLVGLSIAMFDYQRVHLLCTGSKIVSIDHI